MADDTMTPERLAELESMDSEWGDLYRETDQAIADLCTALRAAWKDSERLDWLEKEGRSLEITYSLETSWWTVEPSRIPAPEQGNPRAAIDAARATEPDGA